ncbi:MAG: RHS repeat protein [Clostridia bacterium]|nr:RHS repeat protein [Clostridia bacterium]
MRVYHYINNGKAYSYEYDEAGNIAAIQSPDDSWVTYEYDSLNQLVSEYYSAVLPMSKGKETGEAVGEFGIL